MKKKTESQWKKEERLAGKLAKIIEESSDSEELIQIIAKGIVYSHLAYKADLIRRIKFLGKIVDLPGNLTLTVTEEEPAEFED